MSAKPRIIWEPAGDGVPPRIGRVALDALGLSRLGMIYRDGDRVIVEVPSVQSFRGPVNPPAFHAEVADTDEGIAALVAYHKEVAA